MDLGHLIETDPAVPSDDCEGDVAVVIQSGSEAGTGFLSGGLSNGGAGGSMKKARCALYSSRSEPPRPHLPALGRLPT